MGLISRAGMGFHHESANCYNGGGRECFFLEEERSKLHLGRKRDQSFPRPKCRSGLMTSLRYRVIICAYYTWNVHDVGLATPRCIEVAFS